MPRAPPPPKKEITKEDEINKINDECNEIENQMYNWTEEERREEKEKELETMHGKMNTMKAMLSTYHTNDDDLSDNDNSSDDDSCGLEANSLAASIAKQRRHIVVKAEKSFKVRKKVSRVVVYVHKYNIILFSFFSIFFNK